jgi:hypothetical protein
MVQPWRRFVEAGYATAILSRHRSSLAPIESELADTRGFACDVGDPVSVESAFARSRSELGEVNVLLLQCGVRGVRAPRPTMSVANRSSASDSSGRWFAQTKTASHPQARDIKGGALG